MMFGKRLLERVQLTILLQALDGQDFATIRLDGKRWDFTGAPSSWTAGAAIASVACACKAKLSRIQPAACVVRPGELPAVDGHVDGDLVMASGIDDSLDRGIGAAANWQVAGLHNRPRNRA
jgi:hypothetical protein